MAVLLKKAAEKTKKKTKKKGKRGVRGDGRKPGALNKPGQEDWLQCCHSFRVVCETFEERQRVIRMLQAYRFMLQRLVDIGGACLRLGGRLHFTKDGDIRAELDRERIEQFLALVTRGTDFNPNVTYYGLHGEWAAMMEEFAHDKHHPFRFKASVWDCMRSDVKAALTTKDPRRGISRDILHVSMERALPLMEHSTLKIMGYETRREFVPFKEREEDDEDGILEKWGFSLNIEPHTDTPIRLLTKGPFEMGQNGKTKTEVKKLDDVSASVFNHFMPQPAPKLQKNKKTGKVKVVEQLAWEYQCACLRLDRKDRLFLDVSYVRPPVQRQAQKHKRSAYVYIKEVPGENKYEGLDFLVHVAVEKKTRAKEKADKWRMYHIPLNNTVRRLKDLRQRKNKLKDLIQSVDGRSRAATKWRAQLQDLSVRRAKVVEQEIRILARNIVRRLKPWACGNLSLFALPGPNTPEERLEGIEPFQWAFFDEALHQRCRKFYIAYSGPCTWKEEKKKKTADAVDEIKARNLSEEEEEAQIKLKRKEVAEGEEQRLVKLQDLMKEISTDVVDSVSSYGKRKKEATDGTD